MLQHTIFAKSSRVLQAVTGLSRSEFDQLHQTFACAYQEHLAQRRAGRTWRRQPGGGRKGALRTTQAKLLFILVYVRLYPIQELQALLFGLGQPQANEWIGRLLPVLEVALGHAIALPARKTASTDELIQHCPELTFLLDATERQVLRPQEAERQRRCYSGKKKRHTEKNTVVTDGTGRQIVYLGETTPGSRHDKALVEQDAPPFPAGSRIEGDSGYQGLMVEGATVITPIKKPLGGELTEEEKALNRRLAQFRIPVEHAIWGVKVHRITHDIFRNRKDGMSDQAIEVAAGLYNFKCRMRDQAKLTATA